MSKINQLLDTLNQHGFEPAQIKTDPDSLNHWGKDWTKHFDPNASVIIFPKSTEQVQTIVQACNDLSLIITPSVDAQGYQLGLLPVMVKWSSALIK